MPEQVFSVENLVESEDLPYFMLNSDGNLELGYLGFENDTISDAALVAQIDMVKRNLKLLEALLELKGGFHRIPS